MERERESPPLPGYAGMFQCLTPLIDPVLALVASSGLTQAAVCLTVRLSVNVSVSVSVCGIVAPSGLTQAAVCLTVRLSVSVRLCHSLHRMALLKCVASLYRPALLRQPSVSRVGVSVSASVCGMVAWSGLTQAAVCLTVHLSVSVTAWHSLHRVALLKPTSVTRSVSVSVSLPGTHCIVWLYSSQRL